ncbi:hypothetical protein [uncultured Leifsonia sp.]|uniref:hypothetical protein n=1 Tax=uncultured Leifsonia sp. TaxID=340359 RepID=UPI0025D3A323|nr:hypothetical protein [uncultured Leifsonia sp.]
MIRSSQLAVALVLCWLAVLALVFLLTPTAFSASKELSSLPWWVSMLIILWTVPVGPALWAAAITGPLFIAIPIREVLLDRGVITVRYRTAPVRSRAAANTPARSLTAEAAPVDDDTVVTPRSRRTVGA